MGCLPWVRDAVRALRAVKPQHKPTAGHLYKWLPNDVSVFPDLHHRELICRRGGSSNTSGKMCQEEFVVLSAL